MSRTKKTLKTKIIAVTVVEVRVPFEIKKPDFSYERHGCKAQNLEFDFNNQKNKFYDIKTRDEWDSLSLFVKVAEHLGARIESAIYNKETHEMEFRLGFNSLSAANDFCQSISNLTNEFIIQV